MDRAVGNIITRGDFLFGIVYFEWGTAFFYDYIFMNILRYTTCLLFIVAEIRKACYNIHMNTREELIKLKEQTGYNWKKFAEYFGIPYRTVQDWYMGKRRMPEYLLSLMVYKFEIEREQEHTNV